MQNFKKDLHWWLLNVKISRRAEKGWRLGIITEVCPSLSFAEFNGSCWRQNLDVDQYGCSQIPCGEFLLSWQEPLMQTLLTRKETQHQMRHETKLRLFIRSAMGMPFCSQAEGFFSALLELFCFNHLNTEHF